MFDISWTEFLLIGVVALIVIGPKELPSVLRTLGQWTRRMRSMAADFQHQFQEALREAEMADLKKQVDDIAQDIKSYDPLKDVRTDVEAAGRDIQASLEKPVTTETNSVQDAAPAAIGPVTPEAVEESEAAATTPEPDGVGPEPAVIAAAIAPVVPDAPDDRPAPDTARPAE